MNQNEYNKALAIDDLSLTEREKGLLMNSLNYVNSDPSGLPGHNLMIIIAKLVGQMDEGGLDVRL